MAEEPRQRQATIFVIDDEEDLLLLFNQFIELRSDAIAVTCADGSAVKKKLETGILPDIALVDFNLNGPLTSVDVCRMITEKAPDCVLCMISGSTTQARASMPGDIQIREFFQKPFAFSDLMEAIEALVKKTRPRSLGLTRYPVAKREQIESLLTLLEQSPDDLSVRHMLAFSLYTAGRYDEALSQYKRLITNEYRSFLSLYYMGHCYVRLRRYEDAAETWRRSLDLAPSEETRAKVSKRIQQVKELLEAETALADSSSDLPLQKDE